MCSQKNAQFIFFSLLRKTQRYSHKMRQKVVLGCAGSVGGQISVYIMETFSIRTQPPAHTAPSALITVNESFTLWYRLSIELVNFLVPYKTI